MLYKETVVTELRLNEVVFHIANMLSKRHMCLGWKEYVGTDCHNKCARLNF